MNLIVLGPPGSGKGTQAKLLAEKYFLNHISSGELLRRASSGNSPKARAIKALLDKGELVPFDTLLDFLTAEIAASASGFVLDGTPRNLAQAEHMDWYFSQNGIEISHVILFDISDSEAEKRLLKRAELENRSDDTSAIICRRLELYHQETEPVINHYRQKGLLITVDARPSIEDIFAVVCQKINP